MMTSGDVCDLRSRCLSFVVYVLAATWCVSVMVMFRSRAARCSERGAQDGNTGMCHNSERASACGAAVSGGAIGTLAGAQAAVPARRR